MPQHCQAHEARVAGDWWDHTVVTADSTLVMSLAVGKCPQEQTRTLVTDARDRLRAGHVPTMFTDASAGHEAAILEAFGRRYPAPRRRVQGRARRFVRRWPQGLAYEQVQKQYQRRCVERIAMRTVYGKARLNHVLSLLGYRYINTGGVGRHNGTEPLQGAQDPGLVKGPARSPLDELARSGVV